MHKMDGICPQSSSYLIQQHKRQHIDGDFVRQSLELLVQCCIWRGRVERRVLPRHMRRGQIVLLHSGSTHDQRQVTMAMEHDRNASAALPAGP